MRTLSLCLALAVSLAWAQQPAADRYHVFVSVPFTVDGMPRAALFHREYVALEDARRAHQGEDVRLVVWGRRVDEKRPAEGLQGRYYLTWVGRPDGRNDELFVQGFDRYDDLSKRLVEEKAREGFQFRGVLKGVAVTLR